MNQTPEETPSPKRRRGGGRSANQRGKGPAINQLDWVIPVNSDHPTEPLSQEGVQKLHETAMRILEEIGIDFLHEEARQIFKKAGCKINGERVYFGRDYIMEMVQKAPSKFTITPRNKDREITVGGKHILFGNVSSPPQLI